MTITHSENYEFLQADEGKWITNDTIYVQSIYMPVDDYNSDDWKDCESGPEDQIMSDSEIINMITNLLK